MSMKLCYAWQHNNSHPLQILAAFLKLESPLLCSQEPVTDLCLEPHEPSPDPQVILILSSNLHLELRSWSIFLVSSPVHVACPVHLILHVLIIFIVFGEE
jgi:hypothetical protein